MQSRPRYRVVAALVERDGRFLLAQRRAEARLPLLWEFPGGRVEPGESDADALRRELREKLGMEVEPGPLEVHVSHGYRGYDLDLLVYRCEPGPLEPRPLGVRDVRWVRADELQDYEFPGADQKSVDALLADLGLR